VLQELCHNLGISPFFRIINTFIPPFEHCQHNRSCLLDYLPLILKKRIVLMGKLFSLSNNTVMMHEV